MRKIMTFIRFEFLKRRRVWPVGIVALLITISLAIGLGVQKHNQSVFVQNYSTQLKQRYPNETSVGRSELTSFTKSAAAYHDWFFKSLAVNVVPNGQGTREIPGFGVRLYVDVGTASGALSDAFARTYDQYRYMRQKNITPMFPDSLVIVPAAGDLDKLSEADKQWVLRNNPHFYVQALPFLWSILQSNGVVALLLTLGALLSGSQLAKELAHKRAHSHWLTLQDEPFPVQVGIQFGMMLTTMMQVVFLPLLAVTLGSGLLFGFGDGRYPVFSYQNPDGFGSREAIMPLSQYLTNTLSLLFLLTVFLTLVMIILSMLLRNGWLTILGTVLVVGLSLITPPIPGLPLTYFHLNDIVTGIAQEQAGAEALQAPAVFINLGWWCVGLLLLIILITEWRRIVHRLQRIHPASQKSPASL